MKTSLSLVFLACSLLWSTGCSALKPGVDPVAVRAEQFVESSMETINSFLQFEAANRVLINDQGLKAFADQLRTDVPIAFNSYLKILESYKANRSAENKLLLEGAAKLFDTFQSETLTWMSKYAQKKAGPGAYELIMLAMAGISSLIKLIGQYKATAEKDEEWTPDQQAAFRDKWANIMAESAHWKIVPLLLLAGLLAIGTWSVQAQTNPIVLLSWTQVDTNATNYAVYEFSGNTLERLGTATTTNYSVTLTPGWHWYAVSTFTTATNESAPCVPIHAVLLRRQPSYAAGILTLDYRQHLFWGLAPGTNYLQWAPSTNLLSAPSDLTLTTP